MGRIRLTGAARGALALALACWASAGALTAPAAAQDSLAPPGADPSWLPAEEWVNLLWLPFDEERLEQVLRVTRGDIFRHVRIDATNTLAQIGARRGMTARRLADALVAPRRSRVSPKTYAVLREHAWRVVTQGHMAQHFLFHTLHQTAIPDNATEIFGVEDREQFFLLRRAEISPLQIGELHGRMRVQMRRAAADALREAGHRGVVKGLLTPHQRDVMLDRQLRQLPRWLGQDRYNGPTAGANRPDLPPGDVAKHPTVTADGRRVVWDAYRTTTSEAEQRGEIHVRTRIAGAAPVSVSTPVRPQSRRPYSAYNSVVAADGSAVAYESAQSSYPLGKRVGQMTVLVRDLRTGRVERVSQLGQPAGAAPRTAFNPSISADGRFVVFEATDRPKGRDARSRNGLWLYDRARRRQALVAEHGPQGAAFLPKLAGDGRSVAYADVPPGGDGSTQVFVRALRGARRAPRLVSRAGGARGAVAAGDAYDPAISRDGSVVAFVSRAGNLGPRGSVSRVYVRDLRAGTTELVSGAVRDDAITPAISADGRYVAFVARRRDRPIDARNLHATIWLHDRVGGRSWLVSRASGAAGAPADGYSDEPWLSADGSTVVFTSTAGNLAARKRSGLAGVFARDMRRQTTTMLSQLGDAARPPQPSPPPQLQTAYVCPLHPFHDAAPGVRRAPPGRISLLQPLVPATLAPPPGIA